MSTRYYIGIDLGGTNLKVGLFDTRYRCIDKAFLSTKRFHSRDFLVKAILVSVHDIIRGKKIALRRVAGIGIGLPGPVDFTRGVVHFFPNIPGWNNVPLKAILETRLRLPVSVDNDAKVMCVAEYRLGAARGAHSAICITLGTGVGGGIILDGKLYRGIDNAAGEIGHLPINEQGPHCNCGGIACLESYVGNQAIAHRVKKIFRRAIALEEVSRLAHHGDSRALRVWSEVAGHLGAALTAVVNLLNIECVVIGGGVANAGDVLFDRIREAVATRAMPVQARTVRIVPAALGADAGMIGAAMLPMLQR